MFQISFTKSVSGLISEEQDTVSQHILSKSQHIFYDFHSLTGFAEKQIQRLWKVLDQFFPK